MKKEINNLNKMEMCITSKCNLKCKHCYQHFEKNKYILSKKQIFDTIDYAINHGCKYLILSGGEFFTRADSYEILDYVLDRNLDLTLVTNGTLIDTNKILKYVGKKLTFQISIDGDEKSHDDRRGKGCYSKTINNIRKLNEMNFKVKINVTLDNNNAQSIFEIIDNEDFKELTFLPVANAGAATINESGISSTDLNDCIEVLYKNTAKTRNICDKCCLFPNGLSINYDGVVYPCSIARDFKLFPMGNINDDSISNIINKYLNSNESDMFLQYKGNDQIAKCSKCKNNKLCNQGCRMRAFKVNGSLLSEDPFCCKIYNHEYENIDYSNIYWGICK